MEPVTTQVLSGERYRERIPTKENATCKELLEKNSDAIQG